MSYINNGLVALVFQTWLRLQRSEQHERQLAKDMKDEVDNHKTQTVLALQWQFTGVTASTMECCWRIWMSHVEKRKDEQQHTRVASDNLGNWKKKNRGHLEAVVNRLSSRDSSALFARVIAPWIRQTVDAKNSKARDQAFKVKVAKYEAAIQKMKDELKIKEEELEDVSEELFESRKKNQLLRAEFRSIMDVQLSIDTGMKDFDGD